MLEQIAHFNDFSPALRKKLEDKVRSYGKKVKYKFNISSENPDPEKYSGKIIWPAMYTLQPRVFNIIDHDEDRKDKSRSKRVGLIDTTDEKGIPNKFKRVRIHGKDEGIMTLEPEENPDDFAQAMFIELHPKLAGGLFQDKKLNPVITIIDEQKAAKEARELRSEKAKARERAEKLSDHEAKRFAAGMNWNDDDEIEILRNKIELLAEDDPKFFNNLFSGNKIEYQATIKKAMDNKNISYDPVGGKILDHNQQILTVIGLGDGSKNEIERFAEYLMTGGEKADKMYNQIKAKNKS